MMMSDINRNTLATWERCHVPVLHYIPWYLSQRFFTLLYIFLSPDAIFLHCYIYFYPQTLSALRHDCLPTPEPGTRSQISARCMARGHETPITRQGDAPRAGDCSLRASGDVHAGHSASKVLRKPEAFPIQKLGPPRTERVRGVASVGRSGPGEVL